MTGKPEVYDITFIGGGPVGLYGAFYAGARDLKTKIIDSQPNLGGRLIALYPEKTIYDVAGYPSVVTKEFVANLVEQAKRYGPEVCPNERVTHLLSEEEGLFRLRTDKGEHLSRAVVLAAGAGAFVPEGLELASAAAPVGKGVYYSVDDPGEFRDKTVVVVGAGDNALEWALSLRGIASHVTLVHRLNKLDTGGKYEGDLKESGIELKYPFYEIKSVHGRDKVEAVTFVNTQTGEEERRVVDALVLNVGFLVNLSEFERWGLELSGNAVKVNERMETNIAGVFAAGDIVTHPGKIKLISTGAGEAAVAVGSVASYLADRDLETKRKSAGSERVLEKGGIFYSGFEAIQLATVLIKEAIDFYSLVFFSSSSQRVKELFAGMQREGYEILRRLQDEVLPKAGGGYAVEDLDDTAASYLRDSVDPQHFGGYFLARNVSEGIDSALEAVYATIRIHEDNIAFFQRLSHEKSLAAVKAALEKIADGERRHMEKLRDFQRELMENPGLI